VEECDPLAQMIEFVSGGNHRLPSPIEAILSKPPKLRQHIADSGRAVEALRLRRAAWPTTRGRQPARRSGLDCDDSWRRFLPRRRPLSICRQRFKV
jgi:hypothetical protein